MIVGAYWWSFFTINLLPLQSAVAELKHSELKPLLVEDRKPPDIDAMDLFTPDEQQHMYMALSVLIVLTKENYLGNIPVSFLLCCSVLLLFYTAYKEKWVQSTIVLFLYYLLVMLERLWYGFWFTMAVVEAYAVRPLIGQWLNDCGISWWMMKDEMNLFWLVA